MSDTISKKANQRLLNEAVALMREQKEQSINGDGFCFYDNGKGLHCVFYPAIEKYSKEFEETSALNIIEDYKECLYLWAKDLNVDFASSLQNCHDEYDKEKNEGISFLEYFEKEAKGLAEEYKLIYPEEKG